MTNEEKRKIYAALAAPFPDQCIQRTEGRITGRGYDTTGIGYQFICNRLNEVLGVGGWRAHRTVTVKAITTSKGRPAFEAICDLTLELGSWDSGDFVVFAESLSDGGHTSMSEADARKGAYTNAIKKAAAMFGCGWQAFAGVLDDDNMPSENGEAITVSTLSTPRPFPVPVSASAPQTHVPGATPRQEQSQARPSAPPRTRLTSKQLSAIWALGRKLGHEQQALRQFVKGKFGAQPEFLSREQASQIIGAMSEQAGNGRAEQLEPGSEG